MLRSNDVIELEDGERYTVKNVVYVYDETTPRWKGDPSPTPAGTVVCDLSGGGLNRRPLRPGTYKIVR